MGMIQRIVSSRIVGYGEEMACHEKYCIQIKPQDIIITILSPTSDFLKQLRN